jgi:small-conductance mechanosensitive channel
LRTEGVPLWTDLFRSDKVFSRERAVDHIRRDAERLRVFWGDHRGAVALHALFVVFVSGLFLYLRAHESRGAEDETTEAVRIFQRPYAAAFLLAAVPAHYLLYAAAPSVARGVIGITSLVAILRTTPILLPASAHAAIYAVATLFFIDRFRDLIAGMPLLERLVFTSEMIFAIVALGLFQRPALLSHFSPSPRWSAMLGFAVRLGIVLLGAAIVASVIGSEIGRVVAVGVFSASYVAMLLSVAYEVMTDVVGLAARSQRLRRLHMFEHHSELLRRRTLSLLRFVAILIWFQVTLDRFGIGESLYGAVGGLLSARLNVGMLSLSLGGVLSLAATLAVAVYTSRFVRFILNEDVLPRLRLGRGVSNAVSATVHQIILIVGFLAALAAGGVDLTQFGILAGALGVGIGFGLQNVVNNFVSGIILLFERPIQPGDTIEVGTLIGEVRRIGMRASIVRTFEGAEVIVPNASLISDQVVNWTLSDQVRRIDVNVSVAYGTDPEKVIALLREVAQNDERLMREPGPTVLFLKFGESALEFQLRSWTADFAHWIVIRSELHVAVNRALRDAGITIPFPQTDLHLKSLPEGAGTHAD